MARSRGGVTLIELMVVVAIAGLISVTAVLQFSGVVRRAKLQWAVDRFSALEYNLRNHAVQHGEDARLSFALGSGRLERADGSDEDQVRTIELGQGVTTRRFLSATRSANAGNIAVDYRASGETETYAVQLATAGGDSAWLLVAGLSGQIIRLETEEDADEILRVLRTEGLHTH